MKNNTLYIIICLLIGVFGACVPPEYNKMKYGGVEIDFKLPEVQKIINLQDRQVTDSLIQYFRHENPTFRYLAALSFGSIKDKKAVDSLARLLKDDYPEVRTAAAFSLGQIGDSRAETSLLAAFERTDTTGKYAKLNGTILESVGKCGTAARLKDLVSINTYKATDTLLLEGQTLGIYRFGLRDTISMEAIKKMTAFVGDSRFPKNVRLVAAAYLGRIKNVSYDTSVTNVLSKAIFLEKEGDIRMFLATALGKTVQPLGFVPLDSLYKKEADYRVKCNILRALNNYDYRFVQPTLLNATRDRNQHVALTAAAALTEKGKEREALAYWQVAKDSSLTLPVRIAMYGAANRYATFYPRQRDSINTELKNLYVNTQNIYEKGQILKAIGQLYWNYPMLIEEAKKAENPLPLRTAATEAIAEVSSATDFGRVFRSSAFKVKQELKAVLFSLVKTRDAGIVAVAAGAIRNPSGQYDKKLMRDSTAILIEVMQSLKIPQEIETYQEIAKTVNYILDSTFVADKKPAYTHPIDWKLLDNAPMTATIKTNKGSFTMQFLTTATPATIANFINLTKIDFFRNKVFHRVVPNFVVQVGCPRGDGYGSLDYTIRSELTPTHYITEGMVGMASAGNHTECSQWFVTHSPTLHLDPNYTLFAQITSGMDIIHQLQQGDMIENVTLN